MNLLLIYSSFKEDGDLEMRKKTTLISIKILNNKKNKVTGQLFFGEKIQASKQNENSPAAPQSGCSVKKICKKKNDNLGIKQ